MSRLALPLTLLLLTLTPFSFAQFTYAPINVPGAAATEARGINKNGEIVGFYKTTACTDYDIKVPSCPTTGFKYVNGTYIKLMVPNGVSTAILGVNDLGDLVGFYTKADHTKHGFIWFHTDVVKTIDFPGSSLTTVAFGINNTGTIVGGLWSINSTGTFPGGGFVWASGKFSNMNPFSPNGVAPCCWSVNGIANSGVITGELFQDDNFQAWFKAGTDQDFYMKSGIDSFGTGVNSENDVLGYTGLSGWFAKNIEANEGASDSTETMPRFITVMFPGSGSTTPFGLNSLRAIVGTYTDSSGKRHGFLAK